MSQKDYDEFKKHLNKVVEIVNKYPSGILKSRVIEGLEASAVWGEQLMTGGIEVKDVPLGRMS